MQITDFDIIIISSGAEGCTNLGQIGAEAVSDVLHLVPRYYFVSK